MRKITINCHTVANKNKETEFPWIQERMLHFGDSQAKKCLLFLFLMPVSISSISCMLFNHVFITSRCHQALEPKNWLVSLTCSQCILMWCRMAHHKGEVCKMHFFTNIFLLILPLTWNGHKSIHEHTDSRSAHREHIIPVGNWSQFCTWHGLHFGRESEGLELETDPHPKFILFIHRKKCGNPQMLLARIRMIFALKTQNHICSENEKMNFSHSWILSKDFALKTT